MTHVDDGRVLSVRRRLVPSVDESDLVQLELRKEHHGPGSMIRV